MLLVFNVYIQNVIQNLINHSLKEKKDWIPFVKKVDKLLLIMQKCWKNWFYFYSERNKNFIKLYTNISKSIVNKFAALFSITVR